MIQVTKHKMPVTQRETGMRNNLYLCIMFMLAVEEVWTVVKLL